MNDLGQFSVMNPYAVPTEKIPRKISGPIRRLRTSFLLNLDYSDSIGPLRLSVATSYSLGRGFDIHWPYVQPYEGSVNNW